ncbi:MAG: hypothetical protein WDN31_08085 [Hyphomicrobium sp.]
MSAVKVGSQTIAVEHVTVVSERSFADVRRKLEETLPSLDPKIADELSSGDAAAARAYDDRGPKLSIFLTRDHGATAADRRRAEKTPSSTRSATR